MRVARDGGGSTPPPTRTPAEAATPAMTAPTSVARVSAYGEAGLPVTTTSAIDSHSLEDAPFTATLSTRAPHASTGASGVTSRRLPGEVGAVPSDTGFSTSDAQATPPSASSRDTVRLYRRSGQQSARLSRVTADTDQGPSRSTCHHGARSASPVWEKVPGSPSTACTPVNP